MQQRVEFIMINGTAVKLNSFHQRELLQDDGPAMREMELVVLVRGTMANRSFLSMLAPSPLRIDIPEPIGPGWQTHEMEVVSSFTASSGPGESSAHRHDVTLRETPASAARRAAIQSETPAAATTPAPAQPPEPEIDEDPYAPVDFSAVKVGGNSSAWATALRQMTTPGGFRPDPWEPPLETPELAGAEAVLVGLRLEALIEQLAAAGVIRRSSVDASFMRLVQTRFINEATPVIGPKAAKQAAKSALEK
jgi:hypothetical protein